MLAGSAACARQGVISEASLRRQERLLLSTAFSPPFDYPLQPHPNVRSGALRHARNLDRFLASPLHQPSVEAFDATLEWIAREDPNGDRSIILDSGCGTGRSTRLAALAEPAALVLGVLIFVALFKPEADLLQDPVYLDVLKNGTPFGLTNKVFDFIFDKFEWGASLLLALLSRIFG